ncbi:sulfatase [Nonomuraea zeae]|uniref:sulfatase family protein n=1 Tax=Nonomuraea zeae TaxID=1642303 RepID=UPI00197F01E4|nr:sulfatase-like hydrolase/transferase [Nonomuraea zeae]
MPSRTSSIAERPNILLLFPDQHRHDWLPSAPDLPLHMPHLAALMERGVRFVNAVTPSPICAPARACLASGRDYDACGVPNNQVNYPLHQETVYQRLRATGYRVGGVGKFDLHKATQDWGLDGRRLLPEWGFTDGIDNEGKIDAVSSGAERPAGPYMAYLHREGLAATHVADFAARHGKLPSYVNTRPTPLPEEAYCDNWVARNALDVLAGFEPGRPWYLAVNFTGPHNPMDVTAGMQRRRRDAAFPPPVAAQDFDADTHQRVRRNYAAMLENIDRHIGRLLAAVAARGELERTLVVYSSDHGEMLGDLGRWSKSTWHHPSMGVPMIVSGPGVNAGVTSDALVSLQDLTATFLDCAGAGPLPGMDGRSLWPILRGAATAHRPHVRCGLDDWRAVYDGRFKLVRTGEAHLLYDRGADPHELTDVADQHPDEVNRLARLLRVPSWEGSLNV